jgi:hypothetical protein
MRVGILVCDHEGKVKVAKCVMKALIIDPIVAEGVRAWLSVELCHQLGFQRVVLEGDSLEIIQALCKEKCWSSYGHLINDVKTLLHVIPQWEIHHVRRYSNIAVHRMAKMALTIWEDCLWVDSIPKYIQDFVNIA